MPVSASINMKQDTIFECRIKWRTVKMREQYKNQSKLLKICKEKKTDRLIDSTTELLKQQKGKVVI